MLSLKHAIVDTTFNVSPIFNRISFNMFSITTLKRANVNGFMPLHDITCFFKPVKLFLPKNWITLGGNSKSLVSSICLNCSRNSSVQQALICS